MARMSVWGNTLRKFSTKTDSVFTNLFRSVVNTLIFGIALASSLYFAFSPLLKYQKSNLWTIDGVNQHYPNLYFFHGWMKDFLANVSQGPEQWSWSLGLGADVISTLSWPIIGDPFALIALLFPVGRLETAGMYMYFARLLVAGVVSYFLMRKIGAKPFGATLGTIIYIFTAFTFFQTMKHAYFANVLIFLPLVFWGIERLLRDRKPALLVTAVCLAAYSNFYFFYMISIFAVLYFVFRSFELRSIEFKIQEFVKTYLRFGAYYALGTLLAAPILLPSIISLLSTGRIDAGELEMTYNSLYYTEVLAEISKVDSSSTGVNQGLSAVALVLIPAILIRRRKFFTIKAFLISIPFFIFIPILGSVFNGFGSPNGRFTFISGLILGIGFALFISDDAILQGKDFVAMFGGLLGYFALTRVLDIEIEPQVGYSLFVGAITIAILAVNSNRTETSDSAESEVHIFAFIQDWKQPLAHWAVFGLIIVNVAMSSQFMFGVRYENALISWADLGYMKNVYQENPLKFSKSIEDKGFYRIDSQIYAGGTTDLQTHANDPLVVGYNGTSVYQSMVNGRLSQFMKDVSNRTTMMSFSYTGFDDRAALLSLLGVKYYVGAPGLEGFVPFGFKPDELGVTNVVYKNQYSVGLGFVYDKVMKQTDFQKLNAVQRQNALLHAGIVENALSSKVDKYSQENNYYELPYEVVYASGASLGKKKISLFADSSKIRLQVPSNYYSELYVEFKNYSFKPQDPSENAAVVLGPNPSQLDLDIYNSSVLKDYESGRIYNRFFAGGNLKRAFTMGKDSRYGWGNSDQLVNLGFYNLTPKTVTLGFGRAGTVKFDELNIYAVPMANYAAQLETLKSNRLTHVRLSKDHVDARLNTDKSGILYLNIPYSDGWKIKVDGKETKSFVVNTAFTGVNVTAGKHTIELDYTTPGLGLGVRLAILSLAILISIFTISRVLRFKRENGRSQPAKD